MNETIKYVWLFPFQLIKSCSVVTIIAPLFMLIKEVIMQCFEQKL